MHIKIQLNKQAQQSLRSRMKMSSYIQEQQNKKQLDTKNLATFQADEISTISSYENPQFKKQKAAQDRQTFKVSSKNDQHRHALAHKDGGLTCNDPKQIDKLRSVGKQMIKLIGRKILSGEFNLTKISIPVKSCYPKTALYNSTNNCSLFPHFINAAALSQDPLQRFKLVLTCLIAQPYYLNMFLKPLNPILGQTLQAQLADGTKIYGEQICHHPPLSYFLIIGPNNSYTFSGYYDIEVNPGLNSLTIRNKGKRKFTFNGNHEITATYNTNEFSSTFFGTSRIQDLDKFIVQDKLNEISCEVQFAKVNKKPTDHFQTAICKKGQKVSKVQGTCLGYVNIDNKRYWDGRETYPHEMQFINKQHRLQSDWEFRSDLQGILQGDLQKAQKCKEELENAQRSDAKLRKANKLASQK